MKSITEGYFIMNNTMRKSITLTVAGLLFYFFINTMAVAATMSQTSAQTLSQSTEQGNINLRVTLDPKLQEKIRPDDTLFVYARAAQGPRMPLAITRYTAADLPLDTQLNASMAMMPQMSLNQFDTVVFIARISSTGKAMPQSGDLYGETSPIQWKKQNDRVNISIDKTR
jgi:cytochrome c-type biogenesis protein CcmH